MKSCFHDGQTFETRAIFIPIQQITTTNKFKFDVLTFCSFDCAKAHILSTKMDPIILVYLQTYAKQVLGTYLIRTAPDRRQLSIYRSDGLGIDIQTFRNQQVPVAETCLTPNHIFTNTHLGIEHIQYNFTPLETVRRGLDPSEYVEEVLVQDESMAD